LSFVGQRFVVGLVEVIHHNTLNINSSFVIDFVKVTDFGQFKVDIVAVVMSDYTD
jgi:hypothetical protein